jgi:hypothetical protein
MASGSGPASGDTIRTDTTLGGFSVKTNAAPFKVLLDDPASAIPHEGPAIIEADPSKTVGTRNTGHAPRHDPAGGRPSRDAKVLRITLDTVLIRSVLDQATPSPLKDALYGIFSQVPSIGGQNVQGYLFYLLTTTPKITYVIGAGGGVAAASLPLSFDFPDLPPPGLPPVVGGATTPGLPASGGSLPTGTVAPPAPGPVVAATGTSDTVARSGT